MKLAFKILLFAVFALIFLFAAGLTILSTYRGNSESWKMQVENVAASLTGRQVSIGQLNDARVFPILKFDGEYIFAARVNGIDEVTQELDIDVDKTVIIGKLQFSVPFWSIFWGQPAIQHLRIEGILLAKVKGFAVELVQIETPKDAPAQLVIRGILRMKPFDLSMELEKSWGGYMPKPDMPFLFEINESRIEGIFRVQENAVLFDNLVYQYQEQELTGTMEITNQVGEFKLLLSQSGQEYLQINPPQETDLPDAENTSVSLSEITAPLAQNVILSFCEVTALPYLRASIEGQEEKLIACNLPEMVGDVIPNRVTEEENIPPVQVDE